MSETNILPAIVVAFAVTAAFMVGLRPLAKVVGLIDVPGGRKSHVGEVPIIGGMAMFIGMFAGLSLISGVAYPLPVILIACFLLVMTGVLDDRFYIPAPARLTMQIAAVLIMVYGANLPLTNIGDPFGTGEISMGRFTLIFTMLVTLTMINAYNLIDGVDGLAGSLGLIALLAVSAAAGLEHMVTAAALAVAAAIVGFLIFNIPVVWNHKIRSFMGDGGSTLLGFTVVWITLGVSQGPDRIISPVHCLWFASIPIYDTLTCFLRRIHARKSPFTAGRDHFHHTLKRGGFGVRATLGILTGTQAIYAIVALIGYFVQVPDVVMFMGWSILGLSQRFIFRTMARHRRAVLLRRRRVSSP